MKTLDRRTTEQAELRVASGADEPTTITGWNVLQQSYGGSGGGDVVRIFDVTSIATPSFVQKESIPTVPNFSTPAWSGNTVTPFDTTEGFAFDNSCATNGTGFVNVYKVQFSGTGAFPSWLRRIPAFST